MSPRQPVLLRLSHCSLFACPPFFLLLRFFNLQEKHALFEQYDVDGDGTLNYDEFLVGIRVSTATPSRQALCPHPHLFPRCRVF